MPFLKLERKESSLGFDLLLGCGLLDRSLLRAKVGRLEFLCILCARPIKLGLGHGVAQSDALQPCSSFLGSALGVPIREILVFESLLDIHGVVFVLALLLSETDLLVLCFGEASWHVGRIRELALLELPCLFVVPGKVTQSVSCAKAWTRSVPTTLPLTTTATTEVRHLHSSCFGHRTC